MSNSIWKTPYKNPKNYQSIMFITKNKSTRAGVFKDGFYYDDANNQYEDDELECWATIYDVKAQADRVERLQKAVDLAIRGLEKAHRANSCITKESQIAYEYLKEIKQLIKGG